MEYSVPLAKLPPEVVFPAHLQDRVRYEPQSQRLVYRGFMTKRAFDELATLSEDVTYHRALEQLFVLTSAEIAPPPSPGRRWAAVVGVAVALAAGLLLAAMVLWRWQHPPDEMEPDPEQQVSVVAPMP